MPLYEYECDNCGHRFEVIQKFSDAPPAACPKCQGPVRKLFSSPAIQFKGSGFYITDYAKKTGTGAGPSAGSSATKSEGSSEKSSEKSSEGSSSTTDKAPKTDTGTKPTTPSS